MSDFKLILLPDFPRPVRTQDAPGTFSLVPFRSRTGAPMVLGLSVKRHIDDEDIASWYTPSEAREYVTKRVGPKGAANAIWQRLAGGVIEAAATTASVTQREGNPSLSDTPLLIPAQMWDSFRTSESDVWNAGTAVCRQGHATYRFFGIKFSRDDIRGNFPQREAPEPAIPLDQTKAPSVTKPDLNRGGRPRKEWWDDFWIAICGEIYEGNLKPKRQADLEKAMLDWAAKHGHEMSEAAARVAARKLFKAWKLEG